MGGALPAAPERPAAGLGVQPLTGRARWRVIYKLDSAPDYEGISGWYHCFVHPFLRWAVLSGTSLPSVDALVALFVLIALLDHRNEDKFLWQPDIARWGVVVVVAALVLLEIVWIRVVRLVLLRYCCCCGCGCCPRDENAVSTLACFPGRDTVFISAAVIDTVIGRGQVPVPEDEEAERVKLLQDARAMSPSWRSCSCHIAPPYAAQGCAAHRLE
jgi:hypothetical protein